MMIRKVVAAAALAAAFGAVSMVQAKATVGEPAPAFELKDNTGQSHKLSDFEGKVLVLFWTNPGDADGKMGCPFITGRTEAGVFTRLAEAVKAEGGVFVAVDSSHFNTAEKSTAVAEKFNLPFVTLIDSDGTMGQAFGARTTPHMFVIGKDGKVVYNGALNDNETTDASKDAEARDFVIEAVRAAAKGEAPEVSETKPFGCSVKFKK